MFDRLSSYQPQALAALRMMSALLFIEHGTQKFFNFPPAEQPFSDLMNIIGIAGVLEVVGGILLLIGLFTRPVAFVLCGFMAVAYFMAHAPQGPFPITNGGEAAALYCFAFLYMAAAGGGTWSIDAARHRA